MLAVYRIFFWKFFKCKKLHIEPFNFTIKTICFHFCSTNVSSSVIKTSRSEGSLLPYFYRFQCHYPLIAYLNSDDMCCSLQGSGGKTPEKQTTPSGKDLETSVADNDEIKGQLISKCIFGIFPSSIYSYSICRILEYVFCHLGCWAVKRKFLKRPNFCLSVQLFSCFHGQKINFLFFYFLHFNNRIKKLLYKKVKKGFEKKWEEFLGG